MWIPEHDCRDAKLDTNLPLLTCHNVNTPNIKQSGKMHTPYCVNVLTPHTPTPYILYNPNNRKHGCVGGEKIYIYNHKSNIFHSCTVQFDTIKYFYLPN
jgi:hypothetical protein